MSRQGEPLVERDISAEPFCQFCTSREPAFVKITSSSPARPMVIRCCKECAQIISDRLSFVLIDADPNHYPHGTMHEELES